MVKFKQKVILVLGFIIIFSSAFPALSREYNPGVSVGQYVKYGNFIITQNGEDVSNSYPVDWLLTEVIAVSGKEVTLYASGQFKNGTDIPTSGRYPTIIYNIENGTMTRNNSTYTYTYGPIVAANLDEGDIIPPSESLIINKTDTKTYLGVSRTVNILNTTYSDPNYANRWTIIYDRASGMMLEFYFEWTQKDPLKIMISSYSVIETNIFAAPPTTVTLNTPSQNDIGTSSVVLGWTASPDNDFSKYEVYMSSSSTQLGSLVTTINTKATTTYTVTNLSPTTTYYFTIRVYNTGNLYTDSNMLTVTTAAEPPFYTQPWFIALVVVIIVIIIGIVTLTMRKKSVSSINQSG